MSSKSQSIKSMLDKGENILWQGKPELWPYLFSQKTIMLIPFGLMFTLFSCSFVGMSVFTFFGAFMGLFGIPFVIVGLSMVLSPLIRYFSYKNVEYAFTDERVIIKSGLWAVNFKTMDYESVKNVQVSVTIADKLYNKNTGNINIFTGEMGYSKRGAYSKYSSFEATKNPYKVFKKLKEVSLDIKTDIEYPNKLRPEENPGYKTEYKNKQ